MEDKIKAKQVNKEYHETHKDEIKERKRLWYIENKTKIQIKNKAWREANKEHLLEYQKQYHNDKNKTDDLYRLTHRIRRVIKSSLKRNNHTKKCKTTEILGCSFDSFKNHLESKFDSWMNWSNYGLYNGQLNHGWDIDHIIPLSTATCEDDIIRLNHYTNLQPLCSKVNRDIKVNNPNF